MKGVKSANRAAARAAGLTHYQNEHPCKRGHTSLRRVKDGQCQECNRISVKVWRKKAGYKTDPLYLSEWRARQTKERLRSYEKSRDLHKVYERNIRKRAKLRSACPSWLSEQDGRKIDEIYKESRRISNETGVKHEVDHILPINGKTVCGLHVPWNMQIITKAQNRAKFNKMEISHG